MHSPIFAPRLLVLTLLASLTTLPVFALVPAAASETDTPAVTLPPVVVESESDHTIQAPFLPDIQGTNINAGKKTSVLDLDALPSISGSNYRQALIQTPGLLLSEESTPLLSIGYRGLEPHRAQYTQVLKDGIPIHADQFGYPEAYYVPTLQTVDRIEFVRGGAALQYGPQPGGALNYVTHRPRTDRALGGGTENTFGEDNTWNSFSYLDGTTGRVGYYFYYNRRETEGFRNSNSDVELDSFNLTLALDATGPSRWFLTLESYREEHGEPGGLTVAGYAADRDATTRAFDRFELDRDAVTLTWEHDLENGMFSARLWAVDYTRASARQQGGGFGVPPAPAALFNNEKQEFRTYGADARYRLDWGNEGQHVFSTGIQVYTTDSPRTDGTGATPFENTVVTREAQRDILYAPVFAENLFRIGNLSITPGVRIETFRQQVEVEPNATAPDRTDSETVPLFGIGVAYDLPANTEIYANLSESYRPVIFTESVPTAGGVTIANDLKEGRAWQTDLGYRGEPAAGFVFDTSVFFMNFEDKVGQVGTVIDNVGTVEYFGIEASVQYDLLRLAGGDGGNQLNALANVTFLDAEITESGTPALVDNTPQYAPDYIARTGLIYSRGTTLKIALLGTFVDTSYANDAQAPNFKMPAYMVWDLTAEWRVANSPFTVLAGVNNLFNEDYYSRVRGDGIDPAAERNAYLGFRAEF
jgi:Fe(3+) dicitrate transport protein